MTLYITEHHGVANRYRQPATQDPLAAYSLSSLSTGPFPQAGTDYIRVSADAAMLLNITSTSTATTLTSTNSFRVAANVQPETFGVSTAFRVQAAST